jgi:hypothetical protein
MNHFFVAGFDFGTSYSKVVLRDQLTGVAKVVTFGPNATWVFPSFVSVGYGKIYGPESNEGLVTLSYPKLIAADADSKSRDFISLYSHKLPEVYSLTGLTSLKEVIQCALVRYFLSVLTEIRRFIVQDHDWDKFDPVADPVVVQIAVPTGLSVRDSSIDLLFQSALAAATLMQNAGWGVARDSSVEDLLIAITKLSALAPAELEDLNNRCITYPEVAAGVQTVLRSPNTPDGKYLTLDVGAGTVDINAFSLYSANGTTSSKLDYWACVVEPLGAARLSSVAPSREGSHHEVAVNTLPERELKNCVYHAVTRLMAGAFRHQPLNVHGNGGSPWAHRSYAYIWGGGASNSLYEEAFLKALRDSRVGVQVINRLPNPSDNLVSPRGIDFGRVAIAFGLSFHKANLEAVRLPTELETFDELYPDYWQDALDQKKLCNCRANPTCAFCHGTGFLTVDFNLAGPIPKDQSLDLDQRISGGTPYVRRKSRFGVVLDRIVEQLRHPETGIVERVTLINRVTHMYRSPRIRMDGRTLTRATQFVNADFNGYCGVVRVRRGSARLIGGGCSCLVVRDESNTGITVPILSPYSEYLLKTVNKGVQGFIFLECRSKRTKKGNYFLVWTDRVMDKMGNLGFGG